LNESSSHLAGGGFFDETQYEEGMDSVELTNPEIFQPVLSRHRTASKQTSYSQMKKTSQT